MKKIPYAWLLFGPYLLFVLGFVMNAAVVFANGHHMPVFSPGGDCSLIDPEDVVHACGNHATHLKAFADFIVTNEGISSIGDFFMETLSLTKIPALVAWALLTFRDVVKN